MPRPGQLTRSRATIYVKTPGGRLSFHRRRHYRAGGRCAITGKHMNLPAASKKNRSFRSSKSSKRPNRPYGGYAIASAVRRELMRVIRDQ